MTLVEALFALLVLVRFLRGIDGRRSRSALDASFVALTGIVFSAQVLALLRGQENLVFQALDIERIGLVIVGYLLVAHMRLGPETLPALVGALASGIGIVALYIVVRYGILGQTDFGTVTGRTAVLITEDVILLAVPVLLLWGLWVDGLLSRSMKYAPLLLLAAFVAVNLASARRGALIFVGVLVVLRAVGGRRPVLVPVVVAAAAVLALSFGLSGESSVARDVRYFVESATLRSGDASATTRTAEVDNFMLNMNSTADWMFGRGLGAAWNVHVPMALDPVAFGSGDVGVDVGATPAGPLGLLSRATESASFRIGWHVYGLDWAYKIGVIGCVAVLIVLVQAGGRVRRGLSGLRGGLRSSGVSLAGVAAVLLLFCWTNPRLAFFAGAVAGLLSRATDMGLERHVEVKK